MQGDEAKPDEDVVAPHRMVACVGEYERVGATVLGLDLHPRLDLVGRGVGAVSLEADDVVRPVGTEVGGVSARRCDEEARESGHFSCRHVHSRSPRHGRSRDRSGAKITVRV